MTIKIFRITLDDEPNTQFDLEAKNVINAIEKALLYLKEQGNENMGSEIITGVEYMTTLTQLKEEAN